MVRTLNLHALVTEDEAIGTQERVQFRRVGIPVNKILFYQETETYFSWQQYAWIFRDGVKTAHMSPTYIRLEGGVGFLVLESYDDIESMLS